MSRPEPSSHEVLDPAVLEHLRSVAAELGCDVIGDVAAAYRSASLHALAALRESLGTGDAEGLRRVAHGLKGGSLQIGAKRVAEIAKQLEALGRSGALANGPDLLAHLESALCAVEDALAKPRGSS